MDAHRERVLVEAAPELDVRRDEEAADAPEEGPDQDRAHFLGRARPAPLLGVLGERPVEVPVERGFHHAPGPLMEVFDVEDVGVSGDAVAQEVRVRVDLRVERVEVIDGHQHQRRAAAPQERGERPVHRVKVFEQEPREVFGLLGVPVEHPHPPAGLRRLAAEFELALRRKALHMERGCQVLRQVRDDDFPQ